MPLTRLSLEERIRLVRYFSLYEKSSFIQKAWKKEMGTDPPSRKTIAALNKKFDETGSVADLNRSGRPKTTRTEEKVALVQAALKLDPTKSIRQMSSELGVNKAAIHRIKQESEKQQCTIRQENRKLREKIAELQRRVDILEGRKPQNQANKKPKKTIRIKKEHLEIVDPEEHEIITTIPTSTVHYVNNTKTVITVLNSDDLHMHTHEIVDSESGEVHQITIEEEIEGEEQEFEQLDEEHEHEEEHEDEEEHEHDLSMEEDHDAEAEFVEQNEEEVEESEMNTSEDYEEVHSVGEQEVVEIQHGAIMKLEPEDVEEMTEMCYVTSNASS